MKVTFGFQLPTMLPRNTESVQRIVLPADQSDRVQFSGRKSDVEGERPHLKLVSSTPVPEASGDTTELAVDGEARFLKALLAGSVDECETMVAELEAYLDANVRDRVIKEMINRHYDKMDAASGKRFSSYQAAARLLNKYSEPKGKQDVAATLLLTPWFPGKEEAMESLWSCITDLKLKGELKADLAEMAGDEDDGLPSMW